MTINIALPKACERLRSTAAPCNQQLETSRQKDFATGVLMTHKNYFYEGCFPFHKRLSRAECKNST
jgi:hypothetical protein